MKRRTVTSFENSGKCRQWFWIMVMAVLFSANKLQAQGPCDQISFSKEDYGPCEFGMSYTTQTDCYIELRFILTSGEFASFTVNSADGFMVQQISPSELWITHEFGFIPTGFHVPLFFTLPFDLNTSMSVAYLNDCAQLGCEIIGGWPIESCPDPQNASIIGVKYRECGSLPYTNQTTIPGWPIQLLDADGNLIEEQLTGADGSYAYYDLPIGAYIVKEIAAPGWTPNVPASGQYTVDLAASQQVVRNFGNCPGCPEDDLYMDVVQLPGNNDTCSYAMNITNVGAYCFNLIDVTLTSGTFASVTPSAGWQVMVIDSQHIQVKPNQGYIPVGSYEPCKFRITGASTHDMELIAYGSGATNPTANRSFSCPILPSPPPCCPMGSTFGPELVCNPDFSLGNQCFSNDYNYFAPGGPTAIGSYSVLNFGQVNTANNQWACIDHTTYTAAGQMLIVDGYGGPIAWEQTVSVTAGTNYSFYAWFNNLVRPTKNHDDPQMALFVDNTQVAVSSILTESPDQWIRLCGTWTAMTTGTVNLSIRMLATTSIGNDVAIDDISFRACVPVPPCQTSIQITQNSDCTVTVCAVTTGPQPVSYQWCDGRTDACFTTSQVPCVPTTYCVTATCSDGSTSTDLVVFTVQDQTPPIAVCNPGVGVDLDVNCAFQVTTAFVDGGSTDNCGIMSMSVAPAILTGCTTTIVTLTVTDWCGNTSTCTMGIQTIEGVPPTLDCPPNLSVQGTFNPQGACMGVLPQLNVGVVDNCDPNVQISTNLQSGSVLPIGPTVVTFIGTDNCGNMDTCSVTVTIFCDCTCPNNLVQNPGFFQGAISGDLGGPGASTNWTPASGSPQVATTVACCDPVTMQMWGNRDVGEAICQTGFNFDPAKTYSISFEAHYFPQPNLPTPYVRFGFTAANSCLDPFTCTTNCETIGQTGQITNQNCTTYTLPNWTPTANWSNLIIRAFNNVPNVAGDPFTISWGRIDNICIQEVQDTCCDDPVVFNNLVAQGFTVVHNNCKVTLTAPQFDSCYFFATPPYIVGGPPVPQVVVPASGSWMFNFTQNGTYTICANVFDGCNFKLMCTTVTVDCDTCYCGSFSQLFARPTIGAQSIPLSCGGSYNFPCPNPGQSIPITGKFECQGTNCPASSMINWTLIDPNGTATNGSVASGPYFFLPIMPLQYAQVGTYTLILKGNCGGTDCPPCIIKFTVNCPNPCPCDVPQFQKDVNQGFATALWGSSCKGCFSPLVLNDCDMVEWKVNGGPILANTNGSQSFCHTFPGAGTYTVTMVVTRKKSDGSLCEVFVHSQTVTITCLIKSPCDESVFVNSQFSQMAVAGGLNSGGSSMKWKGLYGDPHVLEGAGTVDGWGMQLSGHIDAADVLSHDIPACFVKGSGKFRMAQQIQSENQKAKDQRIAIFFNRGDSYVFNVFNPETCYRVAVLDVTEYDEETWFDLEIPYDLSEWSALDTCGDNVVLVRPIIYPFTCFEASQGPETSNRIVLDHLCIDHSLVAVDDPFRPKLRIAPNPTSASFTVTLPQPATPGMRFRITDLAGRMLQELETAPGTEQQTVQAGALPDGLYFLQVLDNDIIIAVEKFVKQ
ncbi:MAG TPA: T9SS type A sorting domain-containing protein [Saprospiraceae bacterium]|nr:T9SS type A sorting domain-containing protein [Saprospiraceae bacterium]